MKLQIEPNREIHIEKYKSETTSRKSQIGKIKFGQYKSYIQIGTYKSGEYKSGNTTRENANWVIRFGKYRSRNICKRQIGKYKSETAFRENKSDNINRKVHIGRC